jgi:glycine/D-amino acid oxidase-like deaminating enzyme
MDSKADAHSLVVDSQERIIIVGAGIVGSFIAKLLSEKSASQITVIDKSLNPLLGSTGHAPGFVGQLNVHPTLTSLARSSVASYLQIPGGFDQVGGLEIASTVEGIETLEDRLNLAKNAGLPAEIISSQEAERLAPRFHSVDERSKALYFPSDGTANAGEIVSFCQAEARSRGAIFMEASVESINVENGKIKGVRTSQGNVEASTVIVATGIWTQNLLNGQGVDLPIIPVGHPYVHGPERSRISQKTPFVRWPENHVYARDHGTFDGFGSYDHPPVPIAALPKSAIGRWEESFDAVLDKALHKFPSLIEKSAMKPFNGIFAVTPDGLPLVGPVKNLEGLWVASAVWVTHAAGVAKVVVEMLMGTKVDDRIRIDIDANRFQGRNMDDLVPEALATYNDIYNLRDI